MRASLRRSGILSPRPTLAAVTLAGLALVLPAPAPVGALGTGPALAQKPPGGDAPPKQVALTQKKIDQLVAVQAKIREVEAKQAGGKQPEGKDAEAADAKVEKEIDGIVKGAGFASAEDFADTQFSVGMVLSGMDPESGAYIGAEAALKKQVAELKADKKMPPKEKKEALDELNEAIKSAPSEKPLAGNVDVVKANVKKLSETQGGND